MNFRMNFLIAARHHGDFERNYIESVVCSAQCHLNNIVIQSMNRECLFSCLCFFQQCLVVFFIL